MKVGKTFTFEAAHFLPGHPKCGQMHGHSYKVEVIVDGKIDEETGMVIDFGILSKVMEPIIRSLDHKVLNEVLDKGVVPTAENLVLVIEERVLAGLLHRRMDGRVRVKVWETATSWAEL